MKKLKFLKAVGVCILASMITVSTMAMSASALNGEGKCTVTVQAIDNSVGITGTFNVYKVANVTSAGNHAFTYEYTDDFASFNVKYSLETTVAGYTNNSGTTEIGSSRVQIFANRLAMAVKNNSITEVATGTIGEGVDLEPGYYLITLNANNAGFVIDPSLVVVTEEDEKTVNVKTSTIEFNKAIASISNGGTVSESKNTGVGEIGATVVYSITAEIPAYSAAVTGTAEGYNKVDITDFEIIDNPGKGITYNEATADITVKVTKAAEDEGDNPVVTTLTKGTDYTVTPVTAPDDNYGNGFKVTLTDDTVFAHPDETLEVTYKATINADAKLTDGTPDNNPNKATLVYDNNYAVGGGRAEMNDEVKIYSTKIVVNKTDGDGNALNGAGFAIYKARRFGEDWEKNGAAIKEIKSTTANPINSFEFGGLDEGTYIIEETQTPSSYKTAEPLIVTISADKDAVTKEFDGTLNGTDKRVAIRTVQNVKGQTLPGTGGIGTALFTIGGISLIVLAGVILTVYIRKRKTTEE